MAKIIIDVKDVINMTKTYTVAEYEEEGRTIAEWVETLEKLEEALKKLKQETRLARTEWDYAKAAGLRKAAEILEEALGGPQERTSELIKKIKDGGAANGRTDADHGSKRGTDYTPERS